MDAVRVLEDPDAAAELHLSKGVHVVFRRERLPLRNVLLLGTEDRRSIFAVPRGEAVYVGTTDTTWSEGHTAWPRIDPADVSYLVAPLHRQLAAHGLGPLDVFAAWAGLRPLVAEPGKLPTEISRKDEVTIGPAGVVSIAGGKLTGYRPMAQATLEGEALLAPVAELMARKLGWSDARRASEVAAVRERLVEDLAFKDHSNGAADPASGSEERA